MRNAPVMGLGFVALVLTACGTSSTAPLELASGSGEVAARSALACATCAD